MLLRNDIPKQYLEELIFQGEGIFDIKNVKPFSKKWLGKTIVDKIGEGTQGAAYMTSDNKVLKFTRSKNESEFHTKLINKHIEHYADVYDVIQLYPEEVFVIEKEYLGELPADDYMDYQDMLSIRSKSIRENISFDDAFNKSSLGFNKTEENKIRFKNLYHIHEQILKSLREIDSNINDVNENNIGLKNGKITCFDCSYKRGGDVMSELNKDIYIIPVGSIISRRGDKYEVVEYLGIEEKEYHGKQGLRKYKLGKYVAYQLKSDYSGVKGNRTELLVSTDKKELEKWDKFSWHLDRENTNPNYKLLSQEKIDTDKRRSSTGEVKLEWEGTKPAYLMTKAEYNDVVTKKFREFNRFISKNGLYFAKPDYYGINYVDWNTFKKSWVKKYEYATPENSFKSGRSRDFRDAKIEQASPELIKQLNDYLSFFETIFGKENISKIQSDESGSNKRSIRRAIDDGTYEKLLREGKINFAFLKTVFSSVGVTIPTKLEKVEKEVVEHGMTSEVKGKFERQEHEFITHIKQRFAKEIKYYEDRYRSLYFESLDNIDKYSKSKKNVKNEDTVKGFYLKYSRDNGVEPKPVYEIQRVPVYVNQSSYKIKEYKDEKVFKGYEGYHRDINVYTQFIKPILNKQSLEKNKFELVSDWKEILNKAAKDFANNLFEHFGVRILMEISAVNRIDKVIPTIENAYINGLTEKGFEAYLDLVYNNGFIVSIETQIIHAGGYNIQKLHLRGLFKFQNQGKFISQKELVERYKKFNPKTDISKQVRYAKNIEEDDAETIEKLEKKEDKSRERRYVGEHKAAIKQVEREKHQKEINNTQDLIDLMKETVKENPSEENKDYLSLLKDTLSELKKKKFDEGGSVISTETKSNLTEEQQKLVNSDAFISWFGDWRILVKAKSLSDNVKGIYAHVFKDNVEEALFEISVQAHGDAKSGITKSVGEEIVSLALQLYPNAKLGDTYTPVVSKVVDENGEPLVVYHGTKNKFTIFDLDKVGTKTDTGMWGNGFYFSSSKKYAETYAHKIYDYYTRKKLSPSGYVFDVFLSLKNPYIIKNQNDIPRIITPNETIEELRNSDKIYSEKFRQTLVGKGYDGVFVKFEFEFRGNKDYELVAFYHNQIKLADGSNTTFDGSNPDIRFDNGGGIDDKYKINLKDAIKKTSLKDVESVGEWIKLPKEKIEFYLKEEPISIFQNQISEMESIGNESYEDEERVDKIYDILKNGGKPNPIFVELNDKDKFIMEGRHRIVAFKQIGLKKVPVIYVERKKNGGDIMFDDGGSLETELVSDIETKNDVTNTPEFKQWFGYWDLIPSGKAKKYSENGVRDVVHGLKRGELKYIDIAAEYLSKQVTSSDILVPIPSREGCPSHANLLAIAISKITGATVYENLCGSERQSIYEAKKQGLNPKDIEFGFYLEKELPVGANYFIVDNVIGTGTTMFNAQKAVGNNAKPLVYSVDENNVSKVVDNNGKPLIVYHGFLSYSKKDWFYEFKSLPAFFSTRRAFAEQYAETKSMDAGLDKDANSYACFLNIKKLFDPKDKNAVDLAYKKLPEKIKVSHGTMWFLDADIDKEDVVEQMSGIVTIYPDHMTNDILKANVGDIIPEKVSMSQYEDRILLYKDEDWAYTIDARYFNEKMEKEVAEYILDGNRDSRKSIKYKDKYFEPYVVDKETYRMKPNEDPVAVEFRNELEKYKKNFIENINTLKRVDETDTHFEIPLKNYETVKDYWGGTISIKKRNLKPYKKKAKDNWTMFENETVQKFLIENGFGGWIAFEKGDKTYAVYEPQNIKLADGTNKTFDINSKDIRFNEGGSVGKKNILYLHGLDATPKSDNVSILESDRINIIAPHLDYNKRMVFDFISEMIKKQNIQGIIGHSYGGFLAYFLSNKHKIPCLIFNPAFRKEYSDVIPIDVLKLNTYPNQIAVVGSQDKEIPAKTQLSYLDRSKTDVYIEKIDHDIPDNIKLKYFDKFIWMIENKKEGGGAISAVEKPKPVVDQYGFYSPIEKRLLEFKQDRASVNKWKDIVGIKTDEAKFTGLADYLNSKKPDETLLKIELLNFIKDNHIELVLVNKSDSNTFLGETYIKQRENGTYALAYRDTDEFVNDDEFDSPQELTDVYENEEIFSGSDVPYKTKYSKYVLIGKSENYTEILVMLPDEAQKNRLFYNKLFNILTEQVKNRLNIKYPSVEDNTFNLYDYKNKGLLTTDELQQLNYIDSLSHIRHNTFSTPHWDERNILVHLRFDFRTDVNGDKVMLLSEIQSDWGQRGKRVGFKGNYDIEKLKKELIEAEEEYKKLDFIKLKISEIWETKEANRVMDLKEKIQQEENFVALAPFVTDTTKWVKLGLKVSIQQAALNGVKYLSWMTGEQENDLYDLSKSLSRISWWHVGNDENTWGVTTYDKSNKIVLKERDTNLKNIEKLLGKDIAEKIKNHEGYTETVGEAIYGELIGDDLKLSGSGMIGFYGSVIKNEYGIVGSVLKSLVKELTGKSEEIKTIEIGSGYGFDISEDGSKMERNKSTQYAIEITPEIKSAVDEGIPMFKVGGQIKAKNPYSICTVSLGRVIGTQKRSKWTSAQLKKYESCVLKVKDKMNEGGGVSVDDGGQFTLLYVDKDGKNIVYSDKDGYKIAVNNPDDAKYVTLWHDNKRVGVLEAREAYLNDYHGHTGKFLTIAAAYVDKPHQSKGFGLKMYQVLREFSAPDVLGFFSDLSNRQNKKVIPRIYSHFDNEIVGDYHIVTYIDGGVVEQTVYFAIYKDDPNHWLMVAKYNVKSNEHIDTIRQLIDNALDGGLKAKAITKKEYEDYELGDEITIDEFKEAINKIEGDGGEKLEKGGTFCKCKFADNRVPSKRINEHLLSVKN